MKRLRAFAVLAAIVALGASLAAFAVAGEPGGTAKTAYFLVKVADQSFVLGISDDKVVSDAMDCLAGRKKLFPLGTIVPGDGGFNIGYGWHLDPASVRLVEVAMEVCDGLPSAVGSITSKVYCPWRGRIVERLPERN
jgi:hypothetical protein